MAEAPFVSVLMPVRNEAAFIERSLGAVLAQDYPHDHMEVLVADGMSTDRTRINIARLQAHSDVHIVLVDNPKGIVSTGLNAALAQARGDIIVRVDGHTLVALNYVSQCVSALQQSSADNVGGRMDAVNSGAVAQAVASATSTPFGVGGARFHYSDKEEEVDTVYMGAWPRAVFDRIGLFDEELVRNQDDEYNYRLREAGGRILLSPRIRSRYYSRNTLGSLWKQYFQYGFWKVRVMQKHPRQMQSRQFVPPTLVGVLLGSALLSPFSRAGRFLAVAVSGSYLLANLAASFWTARKHSRRHLPLLPVVFAILHLSYGAGFLVGLAKFWNRWGR
jgi:glycosyltransferase involved in cell wall biosynthesis